MIKYIWVLIGGLMVVVMFSAGILYLSSPIDGKGRPDPNMLSTTECRDKYSVDSYDIPKECWGRI